MNSPTSQDPLHPQQTHGPKFTIPPPNGMLNTIIILGQHYTHKIDSISTGPNNNVAFVIATGWARKRYGSRLSCGTHYSSSNTPLLLPLPLICLSPSQTWSSHPFLKPKQPHKLHPFAGPSPTLTTQPGPLKNALLPSFYPIHNTFRSTPQIPEQLPTHSIRRGPIKPPPHHPPPSSINPTPLLQRNKRTSRAPTSNKDDLDQLNPPSLPLPQPTTFSPHTHKSPPGSVLTVPSLVHVHQPPTVTSPTFKPKKTPEQIPITS